MQEKVKKRKNKKHKLLVFISLKLAFYFELSKNRQNMKQNEIKR